MISFFLFNFKKYFQGFFFIFGLNFLEERFFLSPTTLFCFCFFVVMNHPNGVADCIMYENVKCRSSEFAIWYCKLVTRI